MKLDQEFINHLLLLFGLMIGFTSFKIASCKPFKEDGEEFSWKKLFIGTTRQLIVITGCCIVYLAGCHCGKDLLLVEIGDTTLTIQGAIDVTILAVLAVYATKYIKNLAIFCGIKEEDSESTDNESCNHGKLIGYLYGTKEDDCGIQTTFEDEDDDLVG